MATKSKILDLLKSAAINNPITQNYIYNSAQNRILPSSPVYAIQDANNALNDYKAGNIDKDSMIDKSINAYMPTVMGITGPKYEPTPGKFEVGIMTRDGNYVPHSVHDSIGLAKSSANKIPLDDNVNHITIRNITPDTPKVIDPVRKAQALANM